MKKVVVVVDKTINYCGDSLRLDEWREEEFEGKSLKVIDASEIGLTSKMLIVKDGNEELAVFRDWMYWKKVE